MRIEALTILRLLYLGPENFEEGKVPKRFHGIKKLSEIIEIKSDDSIKLIFKNVYVHFARFFRFYNDGYIDNANFIYFYRMAEENMAFYFLRFLVDLLALNTLSLKHFKPNLLRKLIGIASEVQHSE
jgi:hypothetical protein